MISWSLTLFFKKNNCGFARICSLESEFIKEIVEIIWKILKEEESATALSRRQHYEYEVFVSFSLEDTHKSFTCHLFDALDRKGIHVYKSGVIWTEPMKAIEKSRIAVVVFSKNYGNLDWCLDELVKIMECKRLFNQRVIPIFYHVSPSEMRKQKGNFTEAQLNGSGDKVNSWRVALTEAANLAGLHLNPYR